MIFLDTSALIPLVDKKDQFRDSAISWWKSAQKLQLATSNIVVIETLGCLRYKLGKPIAVSTGERLFFSQDMHLERVTMDDESKAWKLFQKTDGRGISMVDCTSVIVMKRLKVKQIFTFDRDFEKFGLRVVPELK